MLPTQVNEEDSEKQGDKDDQDVLSSSSQNETQRAKGNESSSTVKSSKSTSEEDKAYEKSKEFLIKRE